MRYVITLLGQYLLQQCPGNQVVLHDQQFHVFAYDKIKVINDNIDLIRIKLEGLDWIRAGNGAHFSRCCREPQQCIYWCGVPAERFRIVAERITYIDTGKGLKSLDVNSAKLCKIPHNEEKYIVKSPNIDGHFLTPKHITI